MRVPIFKRTAAILLLTLCVCAVSCRSEEPQPANPSGERVELPGQDAEPEEVLRSYRDDLPERLPLSRQKEFKNIKNLVIRQAMQLGKEIQEEAESRSERAGPDPIPEASTHTGWASQDRYRSAAQRNAVQLLRHLGNLFREQAPVSAMPAPRLVDQKLRRKIQEKKKALGLKQGGPEMR